MDFKDVKCERNGCEKPVDGHYHSEGDYKWYPVIEVKKKKAKVFYYGQTLVEYLKQAKLVDGFMVENENWSTDLWRDREKGA